MLWKRLLRAIQPRSRIGYTIGRALSLREQGQLAGAERLLREALAGNPRDAVVATNLGIVLLEQNHGQQGVEMLQRALACDPNCAAAHYNLANILRASGQTDQAIVHYRAASDLDQGIAPAGEELMHTLLEVCDWDQARAQADKLRALVASRPAEMWMPAIAPLTAMYLELDVAVSKQVARYHAAQRVRGTKTTRRKDFSHEDASARMRIAYLSRDFRDHPVGQLIRPAFALHDRSRFEVFAFSFGPDDGSVCRSAIAGAADHFVDVTNHTDEQAARAIAAAGIHVLVDLAGHTTGNRLGMLAHGPAPVQVHYLGYPGTIGANYIDYFITDQIATPSQYAAEFTEQLAYMPDCFMVGDTPETSNMTAITRASQGLPEEAFVFCNFANSSRITRGVFALWMDVLRAVPDSVLWLKQSHPLTVGNLRREAQRCAMDPDRLVFAQQVPDKGMHMARLALADLALDTLGWYNGHSLTSDMLWAGVPVLTAPGRTFASRVAASLVHAAGLPRMVADDARSYVETAVRLGSDPRQCASLRNTLADNKRSASFFDARRTVAGLEFLYQEMWRCSRTGCAPRTIGQ